MQDTNGHPVDVELLGYHIPTAEVCLLSPQVLLHTFGGTVSSQEPASTLLCLMEINFQPVIVHEATFL